MSKDEALVEITKLREQLRATNKLYDGLQQELTVNRERVKVLDGALARILQSARKSASGRPSNAAMLAGTVALARNMKSETV